MRSWHAACQTHKTSDAGAGTGNLTRARGVRSMLPRARESETHSGTCVGKIRLDWAVTRQQLLAARRRACTGCQWRRRELDESENMSTARIMRPYAALLGSVALLSAAVGGCGGDATGPVRPPEQSCPSAAVPICENDEH